MSGETTQGHRGADGSWNSDRQPGEYWRNGDHWYVITPRFDHFVDLSTWQITEHEDGSITVSPSIFVNKGRPNAWHGFLELGLWREASQ